MGPDNSKTFSYNKMQGVRDSMIIGKRFPISSRIERLSR